jgi:hypothetical protein
MSICQKLKIYCKTVNINSGTLNIEVRQSKYSLSRRKAGPKSEWLARYLQRAGHLVATKKELWKTSYYWAFRYGFEPNARQ